MRMTMMMAITCLLTLFMAGCNWTDEVANLAALKKECAALDEKVKELGAKEIGPIIEGTIKRCHKQGWWNDAPVQ